MKTRHDALLEQVLQRIHWLLRERQQHKRMDIPTLISREQIHAVASTLVQHSPLHTLTTYFRLLTLQQLQTELAPEVPCRVVLPLTDSELRLVALALIFETNRKPGASLTASPLNWSLAKAGGSILGATGWTSSSSVSPRLVVPSDYWSSRKRASVRTGSPRTGSASTTKSLHSN